jgi:mRNA (guanine-N7-)-methyltransferase
MANHAVHGALYNMKVLNRSGTISDQEWEISGMYMAVKFRKEKESSIVIDDDDCADEVEDESDVEIEAESSQQPMQQTKIDMNDPKVKSKYILAMMTAKRQCGDKWQTMTGDERNVKTNEVLVNLMN